MRNLFSPLACSLLACASLSLLTGGAATAQNPDCDNVQFSEDVLERFPQAPESCLDVISRGGQEYAVFRVHLDRVRGNTVRVRFRQPDGSHGPATTIRTQPEFRALVDGKPTRVQDLAPNQELMAYVHVSRPMVALAPASETATLHVVPIFAAAGEDSTRLAAAEDDEAVMPDTAGPAPLAGVAGLLFLAAGGVLALRRRRGPRPGIHG